MSPRSVVVRALSTPIEVRCDDSLTDAEAASLLAPWRDLATNDSPTVSIDVRQSDPSEIGSVAPPPGNAERSVVAPTIRSLGDRLSGEITLAALSGLRGEALLLHAAGVALEDGRVIGLIGPSGRGKTTASRELATRLGYVTDEALAILPDLSVVPFPKPLSIVSPVGGKDHRPASELGLRTASHPLRLAALVLLDRRPGYERPVIESTELKTGIAELVTQTSFLVDLPQPLTMLTDIVAATGGLRRVIYSEASTLEGAIEKVLAETSESPLMASVTERSQRDCDDRTERDTERPSSMRHLQTDADGGLRRTRHIDSVFVGDDLYVFRSGEVVVLEGIGPTIWLAADGLTRDQLVDVALAEFGVPPAGVDPGDAIDQALTELLDRGLLARSD